MGPEQWSINKVNCYKTPIPHIWSNTIVSRDIYDRLYEQWDNIEHTHWRKFINDKEIEIYFHNDFTNALTLKKNKEFFYSAFNWRIEN